MTTVNCKNKFEAEFRFSEWTAADRTVGPMRKLHNSLGLFLDILIVFVLLMDFLLFPFIKIPVVAVIVSADVAVRCSIWSPTNS